MWIGETTEKLFNPKSGFYGILAVQEQEGDEEKPYDRIYHGMFKDGCFKGQKITY